MKPDDNALVQALEELAHFVWESHKKERHFTFIYPNNDWDQHPSHGGSVKTEIVQSRRTHPDEWRRSKAVVLSYQQNGGVFRLNVVIDNDGEMQTYALNVAGKTGKTTWRTLDTKAAALLKEALTVAHR